MLEYLRTPLLPLNICIDKASEGAQKGERDWECADVTKASIFV